MYLETLDIQKHNRPIGCRQKSLIEILCDLPSKRSSEIDSQRNVLEMKQRRQVNGDKTMKCWIYAKNQNKVYQKLIINVNQDPYGYYLCLHGKLSPLDTGPQTFTRSRADIFILSQLCRSFCQSPVQFYHIRKTLLSVYFL